jgi:hypoxanthine phosphoribosyltransferase
LGHKSTDPEIKLDVAGSVVSNREVIVLDDCLDSGKSYAFIRNSLLEKGAISVKLAVLVEKDKPRADDLTADYFGFKLPDVWLVGMGMDDGQKGPEFGRWLNYIAKV